MIEFNDNPSLDKYAKTNNEKRKKKKKKTNRKNENDKDKEETTLIYVYVWKRHRKLFGLLLLWFLFIVKDQLDFIITMLIRLSTL